ncbi:hypothetical protein CLV44_12120 [Marinobacterium halophilum]|uniref:Uncharacterized protein n=1 Tax=Marinobacterium halophilum TaxID=267374 RepID=A0A2P8ER11_9GAMM|nr:hypothetical protein [Marinobacterium halophilum]PSL11912.1 hypothetical protein CLV44_12120 [Marinobacterium halophilum]
MTNRMFRSISETTEKNWQRIYSEKFSMVTNLGEHILEHLTLLRGDYAGFPAVRPTISPRPSLLKEIQQ